MAQTISNHLNTKQVKVCYSDKFAIQMFAMRPYSKALQDHLVLRARSILKTRTPPKANVDKKLNEGNNKTTQKAQKALCKFYQKGKCRHNENCRFDHPKICYKFRAFGSKKFNEKGCEEANYKFFHPNACRDSLKTRTCPRSECRFYHLKGIKNIETKAQNRPAQNKQQYKVD